MDVLKSCLQRNPSKRPPIGGQGGLLQHPFLQPQGERAMQLFQAATLGNENMQDVVKQILSSVDDPIWEEENCIDKICKVAFSHITDVKVLAKQCQNNSRLNFYEAIENVKESHCSCMFTHNSILHPLLLLPLLRPLKHYHLDITQNEIDLPSSSVS